MLNPFLFQPWEPPEIRDFPPVEQRNSSNPNAKQSLTNVPTSYEQSEYGSFSRKNLIWRLVASQHLSISFLITICALTSTDCILFISTKISNVIYSTCDNVYKCAIFLTTQQTQAILHYINYAYVALPLLGILAMTNTYNCSKRSVVMLKLLINYICTLLAGADPGCFIR